MAELDYAFLADFARVEANGTLTAISASWTYLQVSTLPAAHRVAVAGRVRARIDEDPVLVRVEFKPQGDLQLSAEFQLGPNEHSRPYGEGMVGHVFALDTMIPLPALGLYEVLVSVNGVEGRRLAFEVVKVPA